MSLRPLAAVLLSGALALAGCFGPADRDAGGPTPDPTGTATPAPSPPAAPTPGPQPTPGPGGEELYEWVWPALADATIRPGVRVFSDHGQCTSNFVFLPPDNRTVYLGFAAHCVADGVATATDGCDAAIEPDPVGTLLEVQGATQPATLVYSSWLAMQDAGTTGPACAANDFAVAEIHPADWSRIHPAMLTFGGPTGLVPVGGASFLDKVLTFGNSGLRPGPPQLDAREGYVWFDSDEWTTLIYTVSPGVPGDSGSGVLMGDGRALGVLVTVMVLPYPGTNGVTSLDRALQSAAGQDMPLVLATWGLIDGAILP